MMTMTTTARITIHPRNRALRLATACGLAGLLAAVPAAGAQEHPGLAAYEKVCATCHGPEGAGGLAPALAPLSYDGDYVLAIAAYNAGPARIRRWVAARGDPRDPEVDVVDWIERIPFHETRNYVQRVLENLHVYRRRLGAPDAGRRAPVRFSRR